jgi:hypothetical protein
LLLSLTLGESIVSRSKLVLSLRLPGSPPLCLSSYLVHHTAMHNRRGILVILVIVLFIFLVILIYLDES